MPRHRVSNLLQNGRRRSATEFALRFLYLFSLSRRRRISYRTGRLFCHGPVINFHFCSIQSLSNCWRFFWRYFGNFTPTPYTLYEHIQLIFVWCAHIYNQDSKRKIICQACCDASHYLILDLPCANFKNGYKDFDRWSKDSDRFRLHIVQY